MKPLARPATAADLFRAGISVLAREDDFTVVALACGHETPIFNASSTWDFPDDPVRCRECKANVLMHDLVREAVRRQLADEEAAAEF